MLKKVLIGMLLSLFMGVNAAENVFEDDCNNISSWHNYCKNNLELKLDNKIVKDGTSLSFHFKINDPKSTNRYPQAQLKFKKLKILESDNYYLEFDCFIHNVKGKITPGLLFTPINSFKDQYLTKLKPDVWQKISIPIVPRKGTVQLTGLGVFVNKAMMKTGGECYMYIDNLRIRSRSDARFEDRVSATPVSKMKKDTRLEININNLLVNGYFREGENPKSPRGWPAYGSENVKFGTGCHDGRSLIIGGSKNVKEIAFRQGGIVLIPGEKYRLSGYIRKGGDFKGTGHICVACNNWSGIHAFSFHRWNIAKEWKYFSVVFTPGKSRTGCYETIIYRTGKGGGFIEVDRMILEPLSEKGLKKSYNKMAKNYFYKNYKKALEKGTLRSGPPSADYKLVWHDEFNGEKVDTAKWKIYDIKPNKWNKYRYLNPSQLKVSDGTLKMTTELKNGVVYEPRISSTKRFVTTYGYIEASIKLHNTKYADASFWMLPEGRMDPSDPVNKGMEIDIMECVLPMYGGVTHTTHWYGYCPKLKKSFSRSGGTCSQNVPKLNKKFHVFGFEWLPNALVFYIDGVESWRLDKKDHPIPACDHNIIFSFGGTKAKIIRLPKFSATFEVDYVRVYKKKQK